MNLEEPALELTHDQEQKVLDLISKQDNKLRKNIGNNFLAK